MEGPIMVALSTSFDVSRLSNPLFLLFLLLLCGHESSGCFNRKPARIIIPRQDRWMPWTQWSACSATCGGGRITRHRVCRKGKECSSPEETEIKACGTYMCSRDAERWTEWSTCSVSCGEGWTERSRPCPKSEAPCREVRIEKKKCNLTPCPIAGGWTAWQDWTSCSVTCGVGTSTRHRSCTNPTPQFGGTPCKSASVSARSCSLIPCHPKVHGNWSSWGSWSACSVTCLEGKKIRQRKCDNPTPAFGGDSCKGAPEEAKACVVKRFCQKPVDGQWTRWESWTMCSERCSTGTRSRVRFCKNPSPMYDGKDCPGKSIELQSCSDICAINGNWGDWTPIKECSSHSGKCSMGWRHEKRKCDNPAPKHGGTTCVGDKVRAVKCWDMRGCPKVMQAPTDFLSRSNENKTALITWRQLPYGIRPTNFEIRFKRVGAPDTDARSVMVPEITGKLPVNGRLYSRLVDLSELTGPVVIWISALKVKASDVLKKATKTHQIVVGEVDGGWSAWDAWSMCSKTCEAGIRTRERRCDSPTRTAKGRPCSGSSHQQELCDKGFC